MSWVFFKDESKCSHTALTAKEYMINYTDILLVTHPPNSICGWLDSFVIPNTSGIRSPLKLKRKQYKN